MRDKQGRFKKGHISWNKGEPFLVGDENPMYGKHHSKGAKKKISIANKGNPPNRTSFKKGREGLSGKDNPMYERKGKLNPFYGKKHTAKTIRRLKEMAKGRYVLEKNPNWCGGLSFEPYGLNFNKELRRQIRRRDSHKCQECGYEREELGYALSVHHIDFNKQNNIPENLISLCKSCHQQTNFNRQQWTDYFQDKIMEK